ncbi:hypothetical protein [Streptomyces lavendulae]|uniref:hypothetical protein n=1 Tax=Streptomyces lavendulae TaxID=1914 RepID=UPI0036EC7767
MCDTNAAPQPGNGHDPVAVRVYGLALLSGMLLIICGNTTPVEAAGFVSPFLVLFEQRR